MRKNEQVDAYLERLEPKRRAALEELRALVANTVPGVVESVQYGMPTYERAGGSGVICGFASQKNYISFYMMDTDLVARHKEGLRGLDCGKSCIRFKGTGDAPIDTLRKMLQEASESPS
jgi:uncharacterized protein YdhG (YjbR/CyaY superfamily)